MLDIPWWAFALFAGIQTAKRSELIDLGLADNGFVQRCMVVFGQLTPRPPVLSGGGDTGSDLDAAEVGGDVDLDRVGEIGVEMSRFRPRVYTLTPAAGDRWREYQSETRARTASMRRSGLPDGMIGFLNKSTGLAGKLALLLHLIRQAEENLDRPDLGVVTSWGKAVSFKLSPLRERALEEPAPNIPLARIDEALRLIDQWLLAHAIEFHDHAGGVWKDVRAVAGWLVQRDHDGHRGALTGRDLQRGPRVLKALAIRDIHLFMEKVAALGFVQVNEGARGAPTYVVVPGVAEKFESARQQRLDDLAWYDQKRGLGA